MPSDDVKMLNVILVGGKFAGAKMQVPEGRTVLNIPDPDTGPKLAVVASHQDFAKHVAAAAEGATLGPQPQSLADCDNPYLLHPGVVTLPALNDVLSFTIGTPPGTSMTDAFMEILAAYCIMCAPVEDDDFEEEG